MLNSKFIGLSVMMFLQFFVWGAWYVTVGNFMAAHGMEDQIGWAYTVAPIAAIISPFFLGFIADRYFATERVLGVLHLLGAVAMFAAPTTATISSTAFLFTLLLHVLCYMPTLGLTNTLAFQNIDDQEKQFPIIRVFGTIGWIVANLTVSYVLGADTSATMFYVTATAGVVLGIFSFSLPHTPPPSAGKAVTFGEIAGLDALSMMKERSFLVFILGSFLICIPLAAYYAFAPVFVGDIGFSKPGTWMPLGQGSEILFMLLMPFFFSRLGVKWMLFVGMAAWVIRYGLFAGGAAIGGDLAYPMVILGILLHGICYDFFFVTGFIYTDKKCPKNIRAQAQGFLVLVTQGLGLGIGAPMMQTLKSSLTTDGVTNWQMLWLVPCIASGVVMILFGILFNDKVDASDDETGYGTEDAPATEPTH
ncbi:nucleoside permease [Bremerella alba]|uniref:Putative nucleoside transporter YegT n=1 Tax=Bremerella alba TaxID=980252 RepID=A0A7V9A606_9BACT|nr:nucleoside permease [Bremerella alba]MBA2113762.1 putative nucleoside transporter YegT [Bremerella alba]